MTSQTVPLSRGSGSLSPHVWTIPQIKVLPKFGNENGWFYGLVKVEYEGDMDEAGVELAEIIPGTGWVSIDPADVASAWEQISHDLKEYRPHVDGVTQRTHGNVGRCGSEKAHD